jgi:hypothetical protein
MDQIEQGGFESARAKYVFNYFSKLKIDTPIDIIEKTIGVYKAMLLADPLDAQDLKCFELKLDLIENGGSEAYLTVNMRATNQLNIVMIDVMQQICIMLSPYAHPRSNEILGYINQKEKNKVLFVVCNPFNPKKIFFPVGEEELSEFLKESETEVSQFLVDSMTEKWLTPEQVTELKREINCRKPIDPGIRSAKYENIVMREYSESKPRSTQP